MEELGPVGDGRAIGIADAETVASAGEDVEFGGGTGTSECEVEFGQALRNLWAVFFAAGKERRRRIS